MVLLTQQRNHTNRVCLLVNADESTGKIVFGCDETSWLRLNLLVHYGDKNSSPGRLGVSVYLDELSTQSIAEVQCQIHMDSKSTTVHWTPDIV